MERADLLALVDAAPGDLPGLTAEIREVGVGAGLGELGRLPPEAAPGRVVYAATVQVGPGQRGEQLWRAWFAGPDRWRIEGPGRRTRISDGARSWDGSAVSLVERPRPLLLGEAGVLGPVVAPGLLLGLLQLAPVGESEVDGRPCVIAAGTPRTANPWLRLPDQRHELA